MVDIGPFRYLYFLFTVIAGSVDSDYDHVLIATVNQHIERNIVKTAAVRIELSAQLLRLKNREECAGQ